MPPYGKGRPRGQESPTHQYHTAYEVVRKLMQAPSDTATRVSYGIVLDWGQQFEQQRGKFAFYNGVRLVFS